MALQALVAGDPSLIWLSIEHVMEEGKKAISHHLVIETTYHTTTLSQRMDVEGLERSDHMEPVGSRTCMN